MNKIIELRGISKCYDGEQILDRDFVTAATSKQIDNNETGLAWLNRFHNRFEKMVWFNPIPEAMWEYDYGYQTIEMIRNVVDMYQLSVEGLGRGLKKLVSAR